MTRIVILTVTCIFVLADLEGLHTSLKLIEYFTAFSSDWDDSPDIYIIHY